MRLLRTLVEAAGADYRQWKALTRVMLKADTRSSAFGGAQAQASDDGDVETRRFRTMAIMYAFFGLLLAPMAWALADGFLAATVVYTAVLFLVGSTILIEFQSVVVDPDDHGILAFRPVSSATYFLVKLTNVVIYVTGLATLLALASLIVLGVRHGVLVAGAALVGLYGLTLFVALALIALYAAVLHFVDAERLERWLSYLQLTMSMGFYAFAILGEDLYGSPTVASLEIEPSFWTLLHPATWYAGLPAWAAGQGGAFIFGGLALGAVALVALFRVSTRHLSLSYADRLSGRGEAPGPRREMEEAPAAPRDSVPARSGPGPLARRLPHELRAAARLIWAQFRFDSKFRMSVLGILPLTVLYLYMAVDDGSIADPFTTPGFGAIGALSMLHFAVLLMPMLLMMSIGYSESAEAGWLYFTTPCEAPRLVRHARTVVLLVFVVPYLVVVGGLLAWFFEAWWHAAVHVVVLGFVANVGLQLAVLSQPALPFSMSPRKMHRTGQFFGLMVGVGVMLGLLGLLMTFAYRSGTGIVATVAGLLVVNLLFELAVTSKVSRRMDGLEFTA